MNNMRSCLGLLLSLLLYLSFLSPAFSEQPDDTIPASSPAAKTNLIPISNPIIDRNKDYKSKLWNLKDVDIRTFIHTISLETKKNFVIDPRVTGKVTFISAKPLNRDELYQAFLSALQVNSFVALPDGAVIKIVPDYVAKGLSSPIYSDTMKKQSDAMAVSVVAIKYVPANELATVLNQFLTPSGHIASYAPSNDLIVADRVGNITHLMHLIRQIDQPRANKIEVLRLHNAQAKTLVETLKTMLGLKQTGTTVSSGIELSLAADDRTNSILMSGGSREQRMQIRAILASLDTASSMPGSITDVIYLKHLHAERAATIVNGLIQNYLTKASAGTTTTTTGTGSSAAATSTSSPPTSGANPTDLFSSTLNQNTVGGMATMYGAQSGFYTSGVQDNDISSIVSKVPKSGAVSPAVQWEESTNSLVVTAPRDLMQRVKRVIAKLDIRRPQVLIEAVIAEVSTNREKELGISFNTGGKVQFLTNFVPLLPLSTIGPNGQLASQGLENTPGQGLSLTYKENQIRLLIAALERDSQSNVLATPNLVTLDNEPAQIKVGSKVSFATAQIQNNPTGGNPFNFFDREDVGLVLTINPQITPNGSIKLLIQQELSAIIPNTAQAGGNPNTSQRFIRTTVMADDGEILVLGGLLQNQWNDVTSKVPILGNIPGLGLLFKDHAKVSTKTNLMIFLRPTILYSSKDDERVSGGKYEFLRQSQLQTERDSPTRYAYETPVLPIEAPEVVLPPPFPSMMVGQG